MIRSVDLVPDLLKMQETIYLVPDIRRVSKQPKQFKHPRRASVLLTKQPYTVPDTPS